MGIARGIAKAVAIPAGYVLAGPVIGAYRGIMRQNTPLNYTHLIKTYPHEGRLTDKAQALEGLALIQLPFTEAFDEDDKPASLGQYLTLSYATITALIPYAATRATRELYSVRLAKKIVQPDA